MRPMIMPRIMYGTAWLVLSDIETPQEIDISRKKERTTDLVIQAVNAGFRGIDTACQPKVGSSSLSVSYC